MLSENEQTAESAMFLVLILILLDHALRGVFEGVNADNTIGLNPYFIGPCSPRSVENSVQIECEVLILILLDHALRELGFKFNEKFDAS